MTPTAPPGPDPAPRGPRVLQLAGADNVRDLGGVPAAGGTWTRHGLIFRSDLLSSLPEEDVAVLIHRVGLRTVVDLRDGTEVGEETSRWCEHNVRWVNCPFRIGAGGPIPGPGTDYTEAYLGFLSADPASVVLAAATLMDPANHPALFHCAAGKDRTGVLAALLLDVVGVPRVAIAGDYALTADGLPRVMARLSGVQPYQALLGDTVAGDHIPEGPTIVAFLEALDERHGGSEKWLLSNGLEASLLEQFRAAMLETRQ